MHHTPALSPSRLSLYAECPALYYQRYVLGIYEPPTIDMVYGVSVHHGIETHFRGGDADIAFMRDLSKRLEPLRATGTDPADWLMPQGLRLIEQVARLGYIGQPERKFIFVQPGFAIPFRGIIDLWAPDQRIVVDWKTTQRPWSAKTIERYAIQRAVYMQASILEFGQPIRFQFVVLGAYPGGMLQVVDATPTQSEMDEAFNVAYVLHRSIEAEDWDCTCRNKQHEAQAA